MQNNFWSKRIPTLFGIVMLIIGVAVTSYLTRSGIIFVSRASPGQTPNNVRITNIRENSFSVSYTTSDTVTGIISYGTDQTLNQTVSDDTSPRLDSLTPHKTHHITVKNALSSKKYYFSITSGTETFLNNELPFEVTTAPAITSVGPTKTTQVKGTVMTPEGQPSTETLVYITTDKGQTLSTFTKSDGSYTIPLNQLRTSSLDSYMQLSDDTIFKLLIVSSSSQSNAILSYTQLATVPTITLSQDYDFTTRSSPVASSSGQVGFPFLTAKESLGPEPKITSPKKDQSLSDQRPTFRGTAQPNTNVTITIHSDEAIEEKVTSDAKGIWSYRPLTPLTPGRHTITITSRDQFGILKTISQSFTVYAAGTTVDQSATPSATIIPTFTPTPAQTITVTPTGLPPTPQPSITQGSVSKGGVPLEPGTSSTILSAGAIITTVTGFILFFFGQGSSL